MRDQRLPDVAQEGATTEDTTPERDDGAPKPKPGLDRHRDSRLTESRARPGDQPDSAPDPGKR